MKIKSLDEISRKYDASIGRVPEEYKKGVNAAEDVVNKMIAGEENYGAAMTQVVANQSRAKGLGNLTDAEWKQRTTKKGGDRIGAGMKEAVPRQKAGFSTYHEIIKNETLAPRALTGRENVENRLIPLMEKMEAKKKELKGGS